MSYSAPPSSPESDLLRKLQQKGADKRVDELVTGFSEHEFRLGQHQSLLDSHGARLSAAEASILSQLSRIISLETTTAELTRSIVTNEAQFAAALNRADVIKIRGTVTLANQYTNTIPTRIEFEPGAKIIFTSPSYCINMAASLTIAHGRIEGTTPDAGYFINIGGTTRSGPNSWLRLMHNWFSTMGNVVTMTGSGSAPLGPRVVIFDNDFEAIGSQSFTGLGQEGALYLTWHLGMSFISANRFHPGIHGNPIYLGQSGQPGVHALGEAQFIVQNQMSGFHRNGIETFSAARAFILENWVEGGNGSFTNTPPGNGIGISMAGGNSVAMGNIVRNVWGYGMEVYKGGNSVQFNTIDGIQLDSVNSGRGMSIDQCFDTLVAQNRFLNILTFNNPRYGCVIVNSHDVIVRNNDFRNVTAGLWGNTGCEAITVRDNDFMVDVDPAAPSLGYTPLASIFFSGVKNKLLNNICTVGPNLGTLSPTQKQNMFLFHVGSGGYVDWAGTLVGPMGALTGVGNTSANLVV